MAENSNYRIEDDEDIVNTPNGRLVTPLGAARSTGPVPLAFTISENLQPTVIDGLAISWTKEAIVAFSAIYREVKLREPSFERNFPYASLRALMELTLRNVFRIEREMGLDKYGLNPRKEGTTPFVYLDGADANEARIVLQPLLNDWISNFLVPQYAKPAKVPRRLQDQVINLAHIDGMLSIENIHARLLPWNSGPTGTAMPPHERVFQLLADQAARLLAEKELFQGLGPMRRIVTSRPRTRNGVELITDPIQIGDRDEFSLVITLEVVTFPSVSQPLLRIDVHKRLWLKRLATKTIDYRAISGTVFSSLRPDIVVNFQLRRRKCDDGEWRWMPGHDFEVLRHNLSLPLGRVDGHAIARGEASTKTSRVMLVHRDTISNGRHGIKLGVPEIDKIEAFDATARILAGIGIVPFQSYRKLKPRHGRDHEAISRMINTPTLISAALEAEETGSAGDHGLAYLKTLNEVEIDALLQRKFCIGLAKIKSGNQLVQGKTLRGHPEKDQSVDLQTLITANHMALERLYPGDRPRLVIFHEDGAGAELLILKSIVRVLWGDALDIMINRLPVNAHGSRNALPGKELKDARREALRVETWRPLAQQIAKSERRTFCLIMARDLYPDPDDGNLRRKDDRVNKPAARQALSTIAGACVQFLLPPEMSSDRETLDLTDFLLRAQAAMKDLISAHSGRFEGVRDAVMRCFGDTDAMRASMPREIIGITIVTKKPGRSRGNIGRTFLPVALRFDVETDRCDMCCAYEDRSGIKITRWERFSEALATISRISPVRLAQKREIAKTRFMDFVDQVISESVDDGARPVVIIDSSNCVHLWSWLADRKLDVSKIEIGQKQWMQDNWKGARIIRIRQDLAPGIVERKEQDMAFTSIEDMRLKDDLAPDLKIEVPSSHFGLFRLDSVQGKSGCVCYLSVGQKTLHMNKRGPSCYRRTESAILLKSNGADGKGTEHVSNAAGLRMYTLIEKEPWVNQWPTPNPLEIVVTYRLDTDDPDRLAELVERLRYGFGHYSEWTILPAPLFFERVVRDYISDFALEDGDDAEEDDEGEGTSSVLKADY